MYEKYFLVKLTMRVHDKQLKLTQFVDRIFARVKKVLQPGAGKNNGFIQIQCIYIDTVLYLQFLKLLIFYIIFHTT